MITKRIDLSTEDKQQNEEFSILSWNKYESKIKNKFGIESKEYLMISLYIVGAGA